MGDDDPEGEVGGDGQVEEDHPGRMGEGGGDWGAGVWKVGKNEVMAGAEEGRNMFWAMLRTLKGSGNGYGYPDSENSGLGMCKHSVQVENRVHCWAEKKGVGERLPFKEGWRKAESGCIRLEFEGGMTL